MSYCKYHQKAATPTSGVALKRTFKDYNMKKLLLLALVSTSLISAEETERAPVGTRPTPMNEKFEHQAARSEREKLAAKYQAGPAKSLSVTYSSHMGAFHNPVMITPLGDLIETEDGARWVVYPNDRFKTYNWLTSDSLKITPNRAWFTTYAYRITNINTSESIQVNLVDRPIYNGVYTYYIIGIDYTQQQICLNDGSIWNLSGYDYNMFKSWIINDTVILGHNDGWFSSSRPNILINCDTETYVDGRCIN